jgi:hypothetical protein
MFMYLYGNSGDPWRWEKISPHGGEWGTDWGRGTEEHSPTIPYPVDIPRPAKHLKVSILLRVK